MEGRFAGAEPWHPPDPQPRGAHFVVLSGSSSAAWLRPGDACCYGHKCLVIMGEQRVVTMDSKGPANLLVSRPSQNLAKFRVYSVLLDGASVGNIRNGETAEFSIEPGTHSVRYKMGFSKSESVMILARHGETVRLVIEKKPSSPMKYWSSLVVIGLCAALSATLPPYSWLVWGIGAFVYYKLNGKPSIRVFEE